MWLVARGQRITAPRTLHRTKTYKTPPDQKIGTMAESPCPIDREWADSLIGLPMAVPEYWWNGYNGSTPCLGAIVAIDYDAKKENYFLLEVDDTPGVQYPMRYDAVLLYADEEHETYPSYHLPSIPRRSGPS